MTLRLGSVVAVLLALAAAPATATADDAATLYDPTKVAEIDLGLSEAAKQALRDDPGEYVEGSFTAKVNGVTTTLAKVGVRLKGNSSFRPIDRKSSFKIKFAEYVSKQKFMGLKGLTLNNMVQDWSYVREVLSYEIFRAAGVPAARTGFAYVRVNGVNKGVYLNLEQYDDVAADKLFPTTGHVYEGQSNVDLEPGYAGGFEVDEGDEDDVSDLEALIAQIHADLPPTAWYEGLDAVADMDEMTRMWAIEQYVGHWDGYSPGTAWWIPNNFYLHSDAAGRFSMLPSGLDQSLPRMRPDDPAADKDPGFDAGGAIFFSKCSDNWPCRTRFREQLVDLRAFVPTLNLAARTETLREVLRPYVKLTVPGDAAEMDYRSEGNWSWNVDRVKEFLAARPGKLDAWLAGNPVPTPEVDPTPTPTPVPTQGPQPTPEPGGGTSPSPSPTPAPAGEVDGQTDNGGDRVPPPVTQRRCRVPKLVGLKLDRAVARLLGSGCGVGRTTRLGRRKGVAPSRWRVVASSPKAGTRHREGKRVKLKLRAVRRR